MSVFKVFAEKVEQLAGNDREEQLTQVTKTYQHYVDDANQLLRDKQAQERTARASGKQSA